MLQNRVKINEHKWQQMYCHYGNYIETILVW